MWLVFVLKKFAPFAPVLVFVLHQPVVNETYFARAQKGKHMLVLGIGAPPTSAKIPTIRL